MQMQHLQIKLSGQQLTEKMINCSVIRLKLRKTIWRIIRQPSDEIKEYVEAQLDKCDWTIDYVFSHTVPVECEPVWAFIPGLDQSTVDKSTELWLQKIAENLEFEGWYAGHYHVESQEGSVRIMFNDYEELL